MAKSMIIKELANGTVDTVTALKRAKVLLSELDDEAIMTWIDRELRGYPEDVDPPSYRVMRGELGSLSAHVKYTNVPLPLGNMPEDHREALLTLKFRDGIDALRNLLQHSEESGCEVGSNVPADIFPYIAHYNSDPFMVLSSAQVKVSSHSIRGIIAEVENRLLDTLILLEKRFGVLDGLDIDVESRSAEEMREIVEKVSVIIYNDSSVNIGDGNTIKGSSLESSKNS